METIQMDQNQLNDALYEKAETHHMEAIRDVIENCTEELVKAAELPRCRMV